MKISLKTEWPNIIITALPFAYLAYIWNSLPDKVPVHWNMAGEIDRYGSKTELLILPFVLPLLTYLIFLAIPFIDPKKQLDKMGKKYHQLKVVFVFFTSLVATYIIYASSTEQLTSTKLMFVGIALLITVLGNYLQSIKPNYFVGIRTPWTLESDEVWKMTHRLAGKLWVGGGVIIAIFAVLIPKTQFLWIFFIIVGVITLIPLVYSYLKFRELDSK